jgi:hypothetical protein
MALEHSSDGQQFHLFLTHSMNHILRLLKTVHPTAILPQNLYSISLPSSLRVGIAEIFILNFISREQNKIIVLEVWSSGRMP